MGRLRHALLFAALALGGCGGSAAATRPTNAGDIARLAMDPKLEKDIAAGYSAYSVALARWGSWEKDDWYGVRWCPRVTSTFVPYKTNGHWDAPPANDASPYWVSDDSETWGEITTHHGWWVHLEDVKAWCWIPGLEQTTARVVWRRTEGLVAWAPEPPVWVDDGTANDSLLWTYVFLGALLEPSVDDQCLCESDAYEAAAAATNAATPVRNGPKRGEIAAARDALVTYVNNHPQDGVKSAVSAAAPSSSSDGNKLTSSTSGPDKKSLPKSHDVFVVISQDPLMMPPMLPRFYAVMHPPSYEAANADPSRAATASEGSSSGSSSAPSSSSSSGSSYASSYSAPSSAHATSSSTSSGSHTSSSHSASSSSSSSAHASSSSGSHTSSHMGSSHR